jgi:hypothetical protein
MNDLIITWDIIRTNRNALLAQSDWTQLPDAPLTTEQKAAWAEYRQALRDLPETYTTPDEVVYPTPPAAQ